MRFTCEQDRDGSRAGDPVVILAMAASGGGGSRASEQSHNMHKKKMPIRFYNGDWCAGLLLQVDLDSHELVFVPVGLGFKFD